MLAWKTLCPLWSACKTSATWALYGPLDLSFFPPLIFYPKNISRSFKYPYKVFIYTEFDCEFQQKKKRESNNISVNLHCKLVSYIPFFFSYKPYQYLGILVASSGKNYKQISTLLFVSFSVNSSSGVSFSGPTSTANENFPKVSCRHSTVSWVFWMMLAFFVHPSWLQPQIQVFRNHNVGKTWSRAVSGPRFVTVIRMRMSSGVFFAYSAQTSQ